MDNPQQDETKATDQIPATQNIDLTGYKFIYRSEPTFVVPLIDFISGLAPLQSPIAKIKVVKDNEDVITDKAGKERNKSRAVAQEFLSHELIAASSFNPKRLSNKFKELGSKLGFKDDISQNVLGDAGIKLNKFYWNVYLIYFFVCMFLILGLAYYFLIDQNVHFTLGPTASPIASSTPSPTTSSITPTGVSTETSTSVSTTVPTNIPTDVPTDVPTKAPVTASPTESLTADEGTEVNLRDFIFSALIRIPISISLGLIFIFITIRLSMLIIGKFYASTLCLVACIYIILELEQDEILSIDRLKKRLLNRIDFLSRYMPSVGENLFHGDLLVKEWTLDYFRTIQKYIQQLEREVIAPKNGSLQELRKEFYAIAGILLHGNYADIDWNAKVPAQDKQTPTQRIGSAVQGFIGMGLPILLILAVVVLPPDVLKSLGVENQVISLFAIAWFLIAADVNLRLGVIGRILDVAKAIKDLT